MSLVNLAHVCSHLQNASLARLGLTSVPYTKLHLNVALLLQKQGFFSTVDLAGVNPPLSRYAPGTQRPESPAFRTSPGQVLDRERALLRLIRQREKIERQHRFYESGAEVTEEIQSEMDKHVSFLKQKGYSDEDLLWARKMSHLTREQLTEQGVEVEAMGLTITGQPLARDTQSIDPQDGIVTPENRASRRLWLGLKYWEGEPVLRKARLISKPTKRVWLKHADFTTLVRGGNSGEVKGLKNIGEVMIISTDHGLMDVRECVERHIGGQPLMRVW